MLSQLQTVLWISAVGASVLFGAFAGFVGLIYALTAPWRFSRAARFCGEAPSVTGAPRGRVEDAEWARRRQAAALAVAVACAAEATVTRSTGDVVSGWRLLHRVRRLSQPIARSKGTS